MFDSGQLGRKTGGGFYRMLKNEDGSRQKQMYDAVSKNWVASDGTQVEQSPAQLLYGTDAESEFVWNLISETLSYAADLVPEISNDIVNVDRAMRWGFNWKQGPFELLDEFGPSRFIERLEADGRDVPNMLNILRRSGHTRFYSESGKQFLGTDGQMQDLPKQ